MTILAFSRPTVHSNLSVGGCAIINGFYNFTVFATTGCEGDTITDLQVFAPGVLTLSDLIPHPTNPRVWYRNGQFTAPSDGIFQICAKAIAASLWSSHLFCFLVHNGQTTPPALIPGTVNPTGVIYPAFAIQNYGYWVFQCVFTMNIRPSPLGLIRVVNSDTGDVLLYNSTDINVVYIQDSNLYVYLPNETFRFGHYHITLDPGKIRELVARQVDLFFTFVCLQELLPRQIAISRPKVLTIRRYGRSR